MPLASINSFKEDIKKFNRQRSYWLILSFFVAIVIITITFFWKFLLNLHSQFVWVTIGFSGIILAAIWWWWTMSLINNIIRHQYQMIDILNEITTDIKYVKTTISYLKTDI